MTQRKKVSEAVIKRLPRYYRHLSQLLEGNIDRISSNELAQRMHITASQVRQDLNNFGGFGQQGYGYNVEVLHAEIGNILGLGQELSCVLVGAGNLGHAVANYTNFERRGFKIKAIFDNNPDVIGTEINGLVVQPVHRLTSFIQEYEIKIAMLTLPATSVKELIDDIVEAGVKGIWNFSYLDVEVPSNVALVNVHLSDSLMTLAYKLNEIEHFENIK
ncbi:MAG: redox-sensing transcriptional repressor Rex [Ruminococcaceae bacterium]|nr:redox-sensing transcriptional repressor Rex [Oscillospiraceae bacterium]